jgi:acetyl-CoA carboxylase biotin carboxyl carrier protein
VTDKFDSLTDEDVRQIGQLVEILDRSSFDYLRVDVGNLKIIVGKGAVPAEVTSSAPATPAALSPSAASQLSPAQAQPAQSVPTAARRSALDPNTVEVTSPMIGRFYARPEPGKPPFVSLGSKVTAISTVALIEVMKVYTSVEAGVDGEVVEVCVEDGAYVEFGAVLFRIKKG